MSGSEKQALEYRGFLIPHPLIDLTGAGAEVFAINAEGQFAEVRDKIGIAEDHHFLEIGCGVGRCAIPLAFALGSRGSYLGIDIIKPSIDWAKENISAKFPQMRFEHYDIRDELHNPHGQLATTDIKLPLADGSIDRIILWSVFTHLFADEISHYLREFQRVLKPDGLIWASCFVITPEVLEAARRTNLTAWDLRFENPEREGCYINNMAVPRGAIGYSAAALEEMVGAAGLKFVRPFVRGQWSGYYDNPESGQDGMILGRAMKQDFDEEAYLEAHPDVAASVQAGQFSSGFEHYEMYGRSEKRATGRKPVNAQAFTSVDKPLPTGELVNPFLRFEQRPPSAQTATDVFRDRWASNLMPVLGVTGTGAAPLFENDARPQQAATALGQDGRLAGMTVLELGPLEGGHSYQLENLGAESITAVEANVEAYLKCLVVKEALSLRKSRFLLGDIPEYLSSRPESFDLVFCSGVLYHMADPLALIRGIAGVTDRCFVWTHYYHPDNHPYEFHGQTHSLDGFETTYWSHTYGDRSQGFWGGNKASAAWLERESLLQAFRHFGFSEITVIHDDAPAIAPNITFAARRRT